MAEKIEAQKEIDDSLEGKFYSLDSKIVDSKIVTRITNKANEKDFVDVSISPSSNAYVQFYLNLEKAERAKESGSSSKEGEFTSRAITYLYKTLSSSIESIEDFFELNDEELDTSDLLIIVFSAIASIEGNDDNEGKKDIKKK